MQLRFNKIHLHNFLSFADAELDLNNMGYVVVSGVNTRSVDNSQSNGSGKSSIFNGIFYALTGETSQGLKNNIENIYANPHDCWVELDFNIDNDNFVVKRIKTPYANMQIYLNGDDISGKGIRESSKILSEYIPELSSTLIGSIIILGQGLPYRFADNHPGGRKDLLEKLTKSDYIIQTLKEKLDFRQQELRSILRRHEDELVSTKTQIKIYDGQLKSYNNELNQYSNLEDINELIRSVHIETSKCLGEIGTFSNEKSKYEKKINEFNDKHTKALNDYHINLSNDTKQLKEDIDQFKNTSIVLKTEIKSLENEIKKLDSIVDICPTCGQKIPNTHKVDSTPYKIELNNKKLNLNNVLSSLKQKEDEYNKFCSDEKKKFDESLKYLSDENDMNLALFRDFDNKLNSTNRKYNDLLKEEVKLKSLEENFSKLKSNINDITNKLSELNNLKNNLDKNIVSDNEHLQVIQSLITLTKKEFRSILLENVIKYMNCRIKELSKKVFNNELLSFELNENYIDIMYDGKYYESLSGGEKQKIDIIIQLALRELLSTQLNIHSNILVVDEIFDNLDSIGCQGIMNLISGINDIESVFIISHHTEELNISYDTTIKVTKSENGISTLSVY